MASLLLSVGTLALLSKSTKTPRHRDGRSTRQCPLWVISGHWPAHSGMSALPPRVVRGHRLWPVGCAPFVTRIRPARPYARDLEGEGISERHLFQSLEATGGSGMTRLHIGMQE